MDLRDILVCGAAVVASTAAMAQPPSRSGRHRRLRDPGGAAEPARNASSQTIVGAMGCIVYQGLMGSDVTGAPVPLLARSVQVSDDATVYTFELRDALWHDGTPVTAEDVRFTLAEVSSVHSAVFGHVAPFIEAIEAPSENRGPSR